MPPQTVQTFPLCIWNVNISTISLVFDLPPYFTHRPVSHQMLMQMHNLKVSTVDVNILFQFEPHFYFCCPDFKVLFNCLVQILPVSTKSIARTVTSEPPIHRAHILSWPIPDLLQSPSLKVTSIFTKPLNPHSLHSTFLFTFTLTYKLFFVSVIFPTLNQSTTGLKFKSFSQPLLSVEQELKQFPEIFIYFILKELCINTDQF